MKARFSMQTALDSMPPHLKSACDIYIQAEFKRHRAVWLRRVLLAVCLVCNDLWHFGDKRLNWLLKGIEDVLTAYSQDAYTSAEGRGSDALSGTDRMADMMQAELASRNINIEIKEVG